MNMLETIGWADYFTYSAAATISYYAFTGAIFYGKDALHFIRQPKMKQRESQHVQPPPAAPENVISNIHRDHPLMPRAHECVDELHALLLQLSHEEPTPTTLSSKLQRLLHKYEDLQNSSFQESISELIAAECDVKFGIELDRTTIPFIKPP